MEMKGAAMSSNWGIKTDNGYVNFIHGTIDKVWDFETSSSIDDIVIFSERAAKGYAKAIKANAIQISISEQPQLTIPKNIAEKTVGYFDKDRPNYFERSTRFVFSNWSSDLNGDNFDDSEFNKRIQIVGAYLNPLTRDLVKVRRD